MQNFGSKPLGLKLTIKKNNTWTLVDLPKGENPIECKWIFKRKYNPDGSIDK